MQGQDWLAERFEQNRGHLRGVAFRMLGSLSEADDAVQEAWLRLSGSDADAIDNLGGWLTTVVSRVCLDMLRSRKSRREDSMEMQPGEPATMPEGRSDPEREAILADSVGVALLVVLDRLNPAERLAFVLHDLFGISFDEIAGILGRSAISARQLASRARRRVQGAPMMAAEETSGQHNLMNRFLAALRAGDVQGLVAVLDPEFVIHIDEASLQPGGQREVRGPETWAKQAVVFARGARFIEAVLVDGVPGALLAPYGRLMRVLRFTFAGEKIAEIEVIGEPQHLEKLELATMISEQARDSLRE
ncbi:sigma-70 family RNA polymerase sigma factor [Edaphobacter sp. HDX4]|uniref:sigma-70 family RNA polymerase sigma factor n=1 Tax=Edaphobacter sp. HDX4 TaxID=2794064 RepID=UPI002FE567A9